MSFILDALRKSEIERQRQSGPTIAEIPVAREDRRLPVALVAIGVLLAVNVGVLLFFLLRDGGADEPEAAAPVAAAVPPAAAPPSGVNPAATAPTPQPSLPVASDPAFAGAPDPGSELYAQAQADPDATFAPEAPDPTLLPEVPAARNPGSVTYADEAPQARPNLPTDPGAGLPPLAVDLHIYADNAAKRAVFINGRRYTQGATIAEGPVVEEITREGAVLTHRGRRFLLPRQ